MDKTWYSIGEVANHFSVSESTVRRLIAEQLLSALRVGYQFRISKHTIEQVEENGLMRGLETLEADDSRPNPDTGQ